MQILAESPTIPGSIFEERVIPSDVALVTPTVVRLVKVLLERKFIEPIQKSKVELCLDEAITNAIVHGNKSIFEKKVVISLWTNADAWGVVIRDQGAGFTLSDITPPSEEAGLWQENGRGLALMTLYMDEVTYYDGGRTVLLRQNLPC